MPRPAVPELSPRDRARGRLLAAAAFAGPLMLYLATSSSAVQFDDAAQFVLCAREWSPAHPPGFPLWVALGHLWLVPFGGLGSFVALCALASVCSAAAIALLYLFFESLLRRRFADPDRSAALAQWAAFVAALACATGATVWQWSNTVEVYALQLLATALAFYGVAAIGNATVGNATGWRGHAAAGIGIGVGLANHHAAMVLLLPFLVLLARDAHRRALGAAMRGLLPALGLAAAIAVLAALLLMLRAGAEHRFAFGQPDTLSRLWHHLSGGFFADSLFVDGVDYGGRANVLGVVLLRHLWLFAVPAALGAVIAWRRARGVAVLGAGYAALLFFLQFGRLHTPNMDAGLLPALAGLSVLVAVGAHALGGRRLMLVAFVGSSLQLTLNGSACNRRGYEAGDAVLRDLDASAPARSVVLLTSWELQTLGRLAIEERGYRPDLILLPSSLKGTHRDLLERHYPELHARVRDEYEGWLAAIATVDPDYVYTDYFTISSERESDAYRAMIRKVLAVAAAESRPVLCDRGTVAFLLRAKVVDDGAVSPCGMLFSIGRRPPDPPPFPLTPGWLGHPFLRHDLCAYAMLHDYRTAARQIAGYLRHTRQAVLAEAAEAAARRLDAVWAEYVEGKPKPRTR